ncbi:hypothetical protein HNQ59_002057 [Chitinivorax tropicus]|uniref:FecR protein domain-containing protein n=1 Tax=Chitinivorax tropicus TaxID=714531 RepID=A0A840MHT0_9PROT|nr:hypothetical protein [Chitinivorax tropicus]MBB5018764.1 hypothetical protein [Chitinivorax tropicus]
MTKSLLWLTMAWLITQAAYAAPIGTLTFLEGDSQLIRGSTKYKLLEGARLEGNDIVELAGKGFVQLEFTNGTTLLLGPQSKALLQPGTTASDIDVFLLDGAIKVKSTTSSVRLNTRVFELALTNATAVARIGSSSGLFMERGSGRLDEILADQSTSQQNLPVNAYWSRAAGGKSQVAQRPTSAFITSLPAVFLDDPRSRLEKYAHSKISPNKLGEIGVEDISPWLQAPLSIRKGFVTAWKPRLSDAGFKAQMMEQASKLPEWEKLLAPPKPAPSATPIKPTAHREPTKTAPVTNNPATSPPVEISPAPVPVKAAPPPHTPTNLPPDAPARSTPSTTPKQADEGNGPQRRKPY